MMSRKLFTYDGADLYFGLSHPNSISSVADAKPSSRLMDLVKDYKNPVWIYRRDVIEERIAWINSWVQAWPHQGRLHYAMKANFNPEILKIIKDRNCGIDAVSLGEMKHAMDCGFKPSDIILSGVGKTHDELTFAIENQIYQVNIESLSEIAKLSRLTKNLGKKISLAIRVNPEVDAETHPNIATALKDSKFGLDFSSAELAVDMIAADANLELKSISFHIGSQITNVNVFTKALEVVKPFFLKIKTKCPELDRLDLGGGLGIDYRDADSEIDYNRWKALEAIYTEHLKDFKAFLILEIGRFLVARSGVLISRVEVIKEGETKKFLILDAGMSLLMRPALYQAHHEILPLQKSSNETDIYTVVGPICESSDVLASERKLPKLAEGDLVALCDAGAYGSSMSSNYNLREPAKEIII